MICIAFVCLGLAVVFMSYAGYALWVAWLARVRPVPTAARYLPDALLPSVTCVMAAANEAVLIRHKLRGLTFQDYPPDKLSIIVVSDGSTDATDTIVRAWARRDHRIRLLRMGQRSGKPTALNLARLHIASDVAVLMDVRQALTQRAIRELVAQLADPSVGVVSGDLRVKGDAYWTYEGFVRKCESRSGSMVQVTGSLYAVRTEDLPEIPPDTILDDVYVPLRWPSPGAGSSWRRAPAAWTSRRARRATSSSARCERSRASSRSVTASTDASTRRETRCGAASCCTSSPGSRARTACCSS